ncbi:MAG: hypothetical protein LBV46_04610, partial [Bacteroidales bacterium]|nr:hypothetical protein [Bacteroidales bacterium]
EVKDPSPQEQEAVNCSPQEQEVKNSPPLEQEAVNCSPQEQEVKNSPPLEGCPKGGVVLLQQKYPQIAIKENQ